MLNNIKLDFNGESYQIIKNKIYDSTFIEVCEADARIIALKYLENVDFNSLSSNVFNPEVKKDYITFAKENGAYAKALEYALKYYEEWIESTKEIKAIAAIITSLYRLMGQSEKAIDFYINRLLKDTNGDCRSIALCTSVAGAYCDIGDLEKAKKLADTAYALQDGSVGYTNELSLVYKRIAKESGN